MWILRIAIGAFSLAGAASGQPVLVDDDGVLRWNSSGEEVALFGVNYSTPFAYAYRAHARLGFAHEKAIDADVAHMARLGFDAYRIHVWDREVSDAEGNLLQNDHLHLLDYLIARLKERDIKILLTPIAWWGNGWPEPDTPTPGFSNRYSKAELSSDPEALEAQQNFLRQFLNHVNRATGIAYKDDPDIIAIEPVNEPSHPEPPEQTSAYVNRLVAAVRSTGYDKPIFYNVSQNWSETHAAAVAAADVDGVSFQWYPAGLVRGRSLRGNFLPHVDHYPIPAAGVSEFERLARMVYEFDAADIPGSYIYPAMARSFREAGMQWATHFAYDPIAIASGNTEYGTHYVNLLYTPGKALSLMIAGEAFRRLPRGRSFGDYPENTTFGPFRVSYDDDLSEMVAADRFYYSNSTSSSPRSPDSLRHVAGRGSSPVVRYAGTGAYFLDKVEDGAWRMEIYPDAVWVRDPFGPVSPSQEVSRLIWRTHPMEIRLANLGPEFQVRALNEGNEHQAVADGFRFEVEPGVYLLTRSDKVARVPPRPEEFHVPVRTEKPAFVLHEPPSELVAGGAAALRFIVASDRPPESVSLYARHLGSGRFRRVDAAPVSAYEYEAPSGLLRSGMLEYFVTLEDSQTATTFPGRVAGRPGDWDFVGREPWTVPVVEPDDPLVLFDARRDWNQLRYPHQWGYVHYAADLVAGSTPHSMALRANVESLDAGPRHFALQAEVLDHLTGRLDSLGNFGALSVRIRATEPATGDVNVGLVLSDGSAWRKSVAVSPDWTDLTIPLNELTAGARALLPRPYPIFLPYWFEPDSAASPALDRLEAIEFSLDGATTSRTGPHGFDVERVMLVRR